MFDIVFKVSVKTRGKHSTSVDVELTIISKRAFKRHCLSCNFTLSRLAIKIQLQYMSEFCGHNVFLVCSDNLRSISHADMPITTPLFELKTMPEILMETV